MKIGTRISPDWLNRPNDLAFLKQIGVDCVDITLDICPGYSEAGGRANREGLELRAQRQPNRTASPAQRPANDHQQAYPVPLGCVRRIDKRAKKVPHFTYTCSCPCKPHLWLPGTNRIHPFSRSSPSIAS